MFTSEFLNECLTYNPDEGSFFWKVRPLKHFPDERACKLWNTKHSLRQTGFFNKRTGYVAAFIKGKCITLHRAAFIMYHGYIPVSVDHINGIRTDNRICNLREATISQNNMNRGLQSNNKSGTKGVSLYRNGKWRARICVDRKSIHLGYFENKSDAIKAFHEAENKYHGEFSFYESYRKSKDIVTAR